MKRKPSKRTIEVAEKILRSEGVIPARMHDESRDKMWTLQWSELRLLALLALPKQDTE